MGVRICKVMRNNNVAYLTKQIAYCPTNLNIADRLAIADTQKA